MMTPQPGLPFRVMIGAGEQRWDGWMATQQEELDLLNPETFSQCWRLRASWIRGAASRVVGRRRAVSLRTMGCFRRTHLPVDRPRSSQRGIPVRHGASRLHEHHPRRYSTERVSQLSAIGALTICSTDFTCATGNRSNGPLKAISIPLRFVRCGDQSWRRRH